ncbi:MAG: autotransporter-associated beta strand repeat-containing protein [Burkholderiales bacterium]|nr:autotransporter-associated beta strand repeat-containing protein [Burkholderiales bacterium]
MRHRTKFATRLTAIAALLAAWPAYADTTIGAGATLVLSSAASVTPGPITFTGAGGTMQFTGSFTLPNNIVFNSGITGTINTNGQNDTLSGILSGAGALSKTGAGTLTLTGNNTYSGGTSLSAGTLAVGSNTALGTGALTSTGGTLLGVANVTLGNGINIISNTTVAANAGTTLSVGSGLWNLAGSNTLTIGTSAAPGTVIWNTSGGATVGASAALNVAHGTLKLGGGVSNFLVNFIGSVSVGPNGTLDLNGASASPPASFSGSGRITSSVGTPTFTTRGGSFSGVIDGSLGLSVTNASLSLTGASYTGGTAIASGLTLTIGGSGDSNLAGVISGAGALAKSGTGTLTLTGNNTYSGGTSLSAGTLAVGSNTALGTGALTSTGGTLLGVANVTLGNRININGNTTIAANAGTTLSFGSGSWGLVTSNTVTIGTSGATGTVIWNTPGGSSLGGSAALNVAFGTLKLGSGTSNFPVNFIGAVSVGPNGTLDLNGADASPPTSFSGSGRITSSVGTPTFTTGGGSFSGVIDGSLGLSVTNASLSLTGANYTGGTAIASGLTLTIGGSGNSNLAGVISGAGALSYQGTGTLTLTGSNTFSGGTTNAPGATLQLGNGALGGTLGNVANGGTLLFAGGSVNVGTVSQIQAGSTVRLRQGGVNLVGSGITADNFIVGDLPGGSTTFNLASGKTLTIGAEIVGNNGGGTFTQSGGTHVAMSLLLGANPGSDGTFNMNGGSFTVGSIAVGAGTGTFNLNGGSVNVGGTLQATNLSIGVGAALAGNINVSNALINLGALSTSGQILAGGSLDNSGSLALSGGALGGAGALTNYNLMTGYGSIGGTGGFTNYGQFQPGGGGLVLSNSGANVNYGNWDVQSGLPLVLSSATLTNHGVMNLNNALVSGTGTLVNASGGTIAGRGTIAANFANLGDLTLTGGALAVTRAFGNSGLIDLRGINAALTGGEVSNTGMIQGAGVVSSALVNIGTVEALGGQLVLGGATSNLAGGLMAVGAGNRLVITQGLAVNAGIIQLTGGTFDNNNRALSNTGQISGFGTFRAGAITSSGRMSFGGGDTVVNGDVTIAPGGRLEVSYNPASFSGNVVNNGLVKTTATSVNFTGSFTNNGVYLSDPSTQVFQDVTLGTQGALQGGVGDVFVVNGNMVNNSQANTLFDISLSKLSFSAGPHNLVWSATNYGAVAAGYQNNFAVGIFELVAGGSLNLTGTSNVPGANALYVHSLLLGGGLGQIASIQSGGLNIYYDATEASNAFLMGANYGLAGGGSLMAVAAVPEPESYLMWLAGIALMGGIAYRRRASRVSPAP